MNKHETLGLGSARRHVAGLFGAVALCGALALGCGSSSPAVKDPSGKKDAYGNEVSQAAVNKFNAGLEVLTKNDKSGAWNEQACRQAADAFLSAAKEQGAFLATAHFNAGVSYQRCGMQAEAREQYELVLGKDPKFHWARVPLALFDLADGKSNVEKAIGEMKKAIEDSKFQNVEALVNLARLEMRRDNNVSDSDGQNDFERAKKNLQRALAIDDAYMPAFNQLAIYYLESARKKAGQSATRTARGAQTSKVDTQQLELAALVCSQAIRKNPNYAAVHNTAGLISVELGNLNSAVASFNSARRVDPGFFEAHMNAAAVNMRFRGFTQAEEAYRAAIKVQPTDYDAWLGLALALRGQINDSNFQQKLAESSQAIEKAKQIDANRPEAYFNDAILTQGFRSKASASGPEPALRKAIELFKTFVQKAEGKAEFKEAVFDVTARPTRSDAQCMGKNSRLNECRKGRILDIEETIAFLKQSEEDRKAMEQEMKQMQAEAEAAGYE